MFNKQPVKAPGLFIYLFTCLFFSSGGAEKSWMVKLKKKVDIALMYKIFVASHLKKNAEF